MNIVLILINELMIKIVDKNNEIKLETETFGFSDMDYVEYHETC